MTVLLININIQSALKKKKPETFVAENTAKILLVFNLFPLFVNSWKIEGTTLVMIRPLLSFSVWKSTKSVCIQNIVRIWLHRWNIRQTPLSKLIWKSKIAVVDEFLIHNPAGS